MYQIGEIVIDDYKLRISKGEDFDAIWFLDSKDAPLNGMIGEVTQESREPHENWNRIIAKQEKSGIAFAYWLLEDVDEDRESSAFKYFQRKWKKANLDIKNTPIWNVRTSWDPDSAFIPHDSLIKILSLAREIRFGLKST